MTSSRISYVAMMHPKVYKDMLILRWVLAYDFVRFWVGRRLFLVLHKKNFKEECCRKIVRVFDIILCEVIWNV